MPPLPSDAVPRPPEDFARLLATKETLLLVGGQAVNLWALYYHSQTAELAPFVSRDVEVLGDRETLTALGRVTGAKPQFFSVKPPTHAVGVLIAKDSQGLPLLIEVLRDVHGVSNEELREPVYTVALGDVQVQVPSPIAILPAKIANVADLAQSGRQDARHMLILARLLPAYLRDLQRAALAGEMPERRLIDYLERLLGVVTLAKAKKVLKSLKIDPAGFFAGLGDQRLPKQAAFLEKRLPRAL
jgi:hypothetical protein